MQNYLLEIPNTPFQTPDFSQIKDELFAPAFDILIQEAKDNVANIVKNSEKPNFQNVIEALEKAQKKLERVQSIFYNLQHAHSNPETQKIAEEYSPKFATYTNDIILDAQLFAKIKEVWENKDNFDLTTEQFILLKKTYTQFVKNGANLKEDEKEKLRQIDSQLAELSVVFGNNVLADTNNFYLTIENEHDLEGLPQNNIQQAKLAAQKRNLDDKWVITLDFPSYLPFMMYAKNRDLRRKLFVGFATKGSRENNNHEIVKKIATLRHQRANLLGFKSHADFILTERMANSTQKVNDFLENILQVALPKAKEEVKEVEKLAKELDNLDKIEAWDFAYYSEKLKQSKYNLDNEMLRPYFQLENVINGVFKVAEKLFQIQFIERNDITGYHPEVKVYEVKNKNNQTISIFYTDFFPRPSKKGGAWMTHFRGQSRENGYFEPSLVSIVCNFTPSTQNAPSLLTFDEVTTLFHEFGHALHMILSDVYYESLSGVNVAWDFVELPSQLMENWAYSKEALDLFAFHYQTKTPIPIELIEKIKESANFQSAYQTVRQISFGILDMAWHSQDNSQIVNIEEFEEMILKRMRLLPKTEKTYLSPSFSHIFQGGYSAGYYSYKWAEVLEADAFSLFEEKGVFDKETAEALCKQILSKGGSDEPMNLYRNFRGQEPNVNALLKKTGLL
jgi:peptidyl-dipeptidase Dcp